MRNLTRVIYGLICLLLLPVPVYAACMAYQTRAGDTEAAIAQRARVPLALLVQANPRYRNPYGRFPAGFPVCVPVMNRGATAGMPGHGGVTRPPDAMQAVTWQLVIRLVPQAQHPANPPYVQRLSATAGIALRYLHPADPGTNRQVYGVAQTGVSRQRLIGAAAALSKRPEVISVSVPGGPTLAHGPERPVGRAVREMSAPEAVRSSQGSGAAAPVPQPWPSGVPSPAGPGWHLVQGNLSVRPPSDSHQGNRIEYWERIGTQNADGTILQLAGNCGTGTGAVLAVYGYRLQNGQPVWLPRAQIRPPFAFASFKGGALSGLKYMCAYLNAPSPGNPPSAGGSPPLSFSDGKGDRVELAPGTVVIDANTQQSLVGRNGNLLTFKGRPAAIADLKAGNRLILRGAALKVVRVVPGSATTQVVTAPAAFNEVFKTVVINQSVILTAADIAPNSIAPGIQVQQAGRNRILVRPNAAIGKPFFIKTDKLSVGGSVNLDTPAVQVNYDHEGYALKSASVKFSSGVKFDFNVHTLAKFDASRPLLKQPLFKFRKTILISIVPVTLEIPVGLELKGAGDGNVDTGFSDDAFINIGMSTAAPSYIFTSENNGTRNQFGYHPPTTQSQLSLAALLNPDLRISVLSFLRAGLNNELGVQATVGLDQNAGAKTQCLRTKVAASASMEGYLYLLTKELKKNIFSKTYPLLGNTLGDGGDCAGYWSDGGNAADAIAAGYFNAGVAASPDVLLKAEVCRGLNAGLSQLYGVERPSVQRNCDQYNFATYQYPTDLNAPGDRVRTDYPYCTDTFMSGQYDGSRCGLAFTDPYTGKRRHADVTLWQVPGKPPITCPRDLIGVFRNSKFVCASGTDAADSSTVLAFSTDSVRSKEALRARELRLRQLRALGAKR